MTDADGNEIGKLFVGGLSQATNNGSLRLYFSRFGEVDDAVVMMDNKTGRSRGFGYVKYREPESVTLALEAKPHILDGKEVDAKQCNVNMKGRNRRSLKVFVGGIGLDQDAESIKSFFRQFGRVTDVNLMMDSNKQRHRGFAFVGFEDEAVVKRLIGLHYLTMNNKQVEIKAMEPPNFGRKLAVTSCLTNAAMVVNANSIDNGCAHACDQSAEVNGLLTGGLAGLAATSPYSTHPHPYLATQSSLLAQPRLSPHAPYEHPAISDSLLQSNAFIHPLASSHYRGSGEALLGNNSSGSSFPSAKQPVPLILTNNQLQHPGAFNSPGLGAFGPSASSLYAVPCQLVPQQFVSSPQNTNFGQIMNVEKGALSAWQTSAINPAQLSMCSPQVAPHGSLVTCPQYLAGQPGTIQNSQQSGTLNIPASILTPYYAVCSPYTTVPLSPDQTNSTNFASMQPNAATPAILTTGFTTCGPPSGQGEASLIQMSSNSRSSSPSTDAKVDAGCSSNNLSLTKVVYPSVIMPSPNGIQSSLIQGSSNTIGVGQSPYGQAPSNFIYPSLPLGWSVHSVAGQSLNPQCTVAVQQHPIVNNDSTNAVKPQESDAVSKENISTTMRSSSSCTKEKLTEPSQVTPTKASGDNLDNFIVGAERTTEKATSASDYRNAKGKESSVGKPEVPVSVPNMWPVNGTGNSRSDSVTWTASAPNWNDFPHAAANLTSPHPWALPLGLIEGTPNYDAALYGTMRMVQNGGCSSHVENSINQPVTMQGDSTQHASTAKPTESNKPSTLIQSSQSCDSTNLPQRVAQYPQSPRHASQTNCGQKQQSGQSIKQRTTSSNQQPVHSNVACTKVETSTGENINIVTKVISSKGSGMRADIGNCTENPSRQSYGTWLYTNSDCTGHLGNSTGGTGKDVQSPTHLGVELECQGPAGAAGDFQRPVHTGHYPIYH